jgi:hypothetical protein
MLYCETVIVSTSPVPNCQFLALTVAFAGLLKLSAQTCFHGGAWVGESDPEEHAALTTTGRKLARQQVAVAVVRY